MANVHAGRIGDVWKHGPLVEILNELCPSWYVETHAGSAEYPWPNEPETEYGTTRVLAGAAHVQALASSPYLAILRLHAYAPEPLLPGSPLVAMEHLGRSARYVFSDIDPHSVDSIETQADRLGLADRVDVAVRDGLAVVQQWLTQRRDGSRLVFLDPYKPFEAVADSGLTPLQVFAQAARDQVPVVLWYGFDATDRAEVHEHLAELWRQPFGHSLWCGEVVPSYLDDDAFDFHTGYVGSGLITAHVARPALERVIAYGRGLEELYATAEIAGRPANLAFEEPFDSP